MRVSYNFRKIANSCPTRAFWRYLFRHPDAEPDALDGLQTHGWSEKAALGSIIHHAVAMHYDGRGKSVAQSVKEGLSTNAPPMEHQKFEDWLGNEAWLVDLIYKYIQEDDWNVTVLETEREVESDSLIEGYTDYGFVDILYQYSPVPGLPQVMGVADIKTVDSFSQGCYDNHPQQVGYVRIMEKILQLEIREYTIIQIKRLKTAGKTDKQCPACKNGKKKRLSCEPCGRTGRVPYELGPVAFREVYPVSQEQKDRFDHVWKAELEVWDRAVQAWRAGHGWTLPRVHTNCHWSGGACAFVNMCWNGPADFWKPDLHEVQKFTPRRGRIDE